MRFLFENFFMVKQETIDCLERLRGNCEHLIVLKPLIWKFRAKFKGQELFCGIKSQPTHLNPLQLTF